MWVGKSAWKLLCKLPQAAFPSQQPRAAPIATHPSGTRAQSLALPLVRNTRRGPR